MLAESDEGAYTATAADGGASPQRPSSSKRSRGGGGGGGGMALRKAAALARCRFIPGPPCVSKIISMEMMERFSYYALARCSCSTSRARAA